jgi:hypothetical protein
MKAPHPPLHVGMAERARNKKLASMNTLTNTSTKFNQLASFGLAFIGFILTVLYGGIIWRDEISYPGDGSDFRRLCLLAVGLVFACEALRILRTPLDGFAAAGDCRCC